MGKVIGEHYLHFKEGGSDKGYVIQIIEEADKKYTLYTAWGRVGNTYQTKVREALSLLEAEKERAKIYGEKIGKGYQSVSPEALGFKESSAIVAPMPEGYDALFPDPKPILFTPMLFTAIKSEEKLEALLKDDRYLAQRKMDGTRLVIRITPKAIPGECLIGAHNKKGQLISLRAEIDRNLRILYRKLGKKYWSEEFVLDGEAIGAEFHIFDMLCNDPSMLLVDRIEMIENDIVIKDAEKPGHLPEGLFFVPTAHLETRKRAMLEKVYEDAWEGLVFKDKHQPYFHGRSTSNFKYKVWNEATVIIADVNATSRAETGSAAIYVVKSCGSRVPIGNVASGFKKGDLEALRRRLFSGEKVFAEVKYLYYGGKALYQPRFKAYRDDVDESDATYIQIIDKSGNPLTEEGD